MVSGVDMRLASCVRRSLFPRQEEQLLPVRTFATVKELCHALLDLDERYNRAWPIERHGFRSLTDAGRQYYADATSSLDLRLARTDGTRRPTGPVGIRCRR